MASNSVLGLSLRYGAVITLAVVVLGSILGFVGAGVPGLVSAMIGAVVAAVFMGLTAISILVAQRVTHGSSSSPLYFAIVISAWIVKILVFAGVAILVGSSDWLNPFVYFFAAVAGVIGSLVGDGIAMQRARQPHVGEIRLPGENS